jgi:hypothetical protein
MNRPGGAGQALLAGAIAGLAAFLLVIGPGVLLDPEAAMPAPPGDWAMTLSGARAFVVDAWRWPLFRYEGLSEAHATNAIFTDSVPLHALLWKILSGRSAEGFAWFLPTFLLLLFLLQGAAAALALRLLGVTARGPLVAGAALFALWPVFIARFWHPALSAHGIVILALALLLVPPRAGSEGRRALGWAALLAVAVLLHAYLFAMAAAAWAVAFADALLRPAQPRGRTLAEAGATALLLAGVMLAAGYFSGAPSGSGGFGHFSASLAAPFIHGGTSALPDLLAVAPGQYEGYAYVPVAGWGLLALALALALRGRGRPAEPQAAHRRRMAPLLGLAALAVALFATGGRFTWGETELGRLPLPETVERIGAVFRSSGRFLWLPVYALLLLAAARVARALTPHRAALALGAAAALAALEMRPLLAAFPPADGTYSGDPALRAAFRDAERVTIHPPWPCGPPETDLIDKELQWLAAREEAVLVNTLAAARLDTDCRGPLSETFRGPPAPGDLLVLKRDFRTTAPLMRHGIEPGRCRRTGGFTLCRAAWPEDPALAGLRPVPSPRPLARGVRHRLARGSGALRVLGPGFSGAEPWGLWSVGERARLELFLAPGGSPPHRIALGLQGFVPEARPETGVIIRLLAQDRGGRGWREVAATRLTLRRGAARRTAVLIPPERLAAARLRVVLVPETPVSPATLGLSGDRRALGVGLRWIRID